MLSLQCTTVHVVVPKILPWRVGVFCALCPTGSGFPGQPDERRLVLLWTSVLQVQQTLLSAAHALLDPTRMQQVRSLAVMLGCRQGPSDSIRVFGLLRSHGRWCDVSFCQLQPLKPVRPDKSTRQRRTRIATPALIPLDPCTGQTKEGNSAHNVCLANIRLRWIWLLLRCRGLSVHCVHHWNVLHCSRCRLLH